MLNVAVEAGAITGCREAREGGRSEIDGSRVPRNDVVAALDDFGKLTPSATDKSVT